MSGNNECRYSNCRCGISSDSILEKYPKYKGIDAQNYKKQFVVVANIDPQKALMCGTKDSDLCMMMQQHSWKFGLDPYEGWHIEQGPKKGGYLKGIISKLGDCLNKITGW